MDYALLAATALGAIGLYLMLPRERAPLVRLGGLLGAMALAGLFLFLIQAAGGHVAGVTGGERPPIYFYVFAAIMIGGAVAVVCQPRPVYAALYFVLVTLAGAGMFVLLMAEFMAVVLIIIYAGAILVTYVFVIMLASQGSTGGSVVAPAYDRRTSSGLVAVAAAFFLVGAILQVLLPTTGGGLATPAPFELRDSLMARNMGVDVRTGQDLPEATAEMQVSQLDPSQGVPIPPGVTAPAFTTRQKAAGATSKPIDPPTNPQVLGVDLYVRHSLSLELAGILLTIALIGAVIIARKNTNPNETLGSGNLPIE